MAIGYWLRHPGQLWPRLRYWWWERRNPDKPFDNYTTIKGQRWHLAFDIEHINTNRPQEYYEGAIVWTTKRS